MSLLVLHVAQQMFPTGGQTMAAMVQNGDWRNVRLRLDEKGEVTHLPAQKAPVEVECIERGRAGQSPTRRVP